MLVRPVQAIRQMYLVNCLYSIQQPLAEHAVARRWVPQLEDTITEHINNLARQEVGLFNLSAAQTSQV
jgi:hypothetical protein